LLGGGIHIDDDQTITDNMISNNTAIQAGGGIFCYWSHPTITNNTITENWQFAAAESTA